MTEETQDTESSEEVASFEAYELLGRDLLELVMQELKAMPDVWQKLSEDRQADVIDRATRSIKEAARDAINLIVSNGFERVSAQVDGVQIKDDIKATLKVYRHNNASSLDELYQAHGQDILIVLASAQDFDARMEEIVADPDQPELDIPGEAA